MRVANRSTGEEVVGEVRLYGLDAELYRKAEAKRDKDHEAALGKWVEDASEEKFAFPDDIIESLRSGIILCKLVNKIRPESVKKINMKPIPLLEMENIGLYLKACWALGVPSAELFVTSDLYRRKDIPQVFVNLHSLARIAWRIPSYTGAKFGSYGHLATKRETKWTGALKETKPIYVSDIEEAEKRAAEHEYEMERKAALPKPGEDPEQANKILQRRLLEEQTRRQEAEEQLAVLKGEKKGISVAFSPSGASADVQKEVEKLRKLLEEERRVKEDEVNSWKRKLEKEREEAAKQLKSGKGSEKETAEKRLEKLQKKRKAREAQEKELREKEEEIRKALQKEFEKKEAALKAMLAETNKELESEKKLRDDQQKYWKIRSGDLSSEPLDKEVANLEQKLEEERKEKASILNQLRQEKEQADRKDQEIKRLERAADSSKKEMAELTIAVDKQKRDVKGVKDSSARHEAEAARLKRIVKELERELLDKEKEVKMLREAAKGSPQLPQPLSFVEKKEKGKEKEMEEDNEMVDSEIASLKKSRRLTRLVSKAAMSKAFLTGWDDDDKLDKEAIEGMNHTITKILYSSASVSREDIVPFFGIFQSDYGRRQLAFTLKTALDKIPSACLSVDAYNLMVELLSKVMECMSASTVKDFITTRVIMQAALRLCMNDSTDKTILVQQKLKQFTIWRNVDYWEEIFWDTLASQHKDTQGEDDDVDAALVYGVAKTLAISMSSWDVPLTTIRSFVASVCDTNKLPINIKNHLLDALDTELQTPRGGSFISKLTMKKKKTDTEKERRELRKLFEETETTKGSKKYVASPGGRVRATILLPENMNERPVCEFGENCKSTDPLHFLNHQHTVPESPPVGNDSPSSSSDEKGIGLPPADEDKGGWRRSRNVGSGKEDPRRKTVASPSQAISPERQRSPTDAVALKGNKSPATQNK